MAEMILCDSTVIIDALNGVEAVKQNLLRFPPGNLFISMVTEWEVLAGARSKAEQNRFQKALGRYHIIELDTIAARQAGILLKTYHLSHGLLIPDALIAATALRHGLLLYTDNKRDFQFINSLRIWSGEVL
jgi:tRNA(fMet)-specific endonuclease VapC